MSSRVDNSQEKESGREEKSNKKSSKDEKKKFMKQVEEFKLWNDQETFQDKEYERRRLEKGKWKDLLKSDQRLQRCKKCYLPSVIAIVAGVSLILCSSLNGIADNSIFSEHRRIFQAVGGAVSCLGLIGLMMTAAYTYRREDFVRKRYGFPSLFEASRNGTTSSSWINESFLIQNEFVDVRSNGSASIAGKSVSRMTSIESAESSVDFLGESFSSTGTAVAWVNKHSVRFQRTSSLHRRQNSDTALNNSLAISRIYSWEQEAKRDTANSERAEIHTTGPGYDPCSSQDRSITSSSSGYQSNVSSPDALTTQPIFLEENSTTLVKDKDVEGKDFGTNIKSCIVSSDTSKDVNLPLIAEKGNNTGRSVKFKA
ncbi:uncharacterized protein LOC101852453 [Aplysia californica]|uniref:Uncharacterized protein LOC101852453 n=1 Tax=Aplysia californica TaxID=6500 RepID=A0ABM0JFN9_APLCA|nr:uncharacterized protein LOC101852453 [Aplysia californica]